MKFLALGLSIILSTQIFATDTDQDQSTDNVAIYSAAASAIAGSFAGRSSFKYANNLKKKAKYLIFNEASESLRVLKPDDIEELVDQIDYGRRHNIYYHFSAQENKDHILDKIRDHIAMWQKQADKYEISEKINRTAGLTKEAESAKTEKLRYQNYIADLQKQYESISDLPKEKVPFEMHILSFEDSAKGIENAKTAVRDTISKGGGIYNVATIPEEIVEKAEKIKVVGSVTTVVSFIPAIYLTAHEVLTSGASYLFDTDSENASSDDFSRADNE